MMQDEVASMCGECGASVYQQHLESGIARYEGDKLLCAHCAAEYDRSRGAAGGGDEVFEPIELDEVEENHEAEPDMSASRIQAVSQASLGGGAAWDESRFKRAPLPDGAGAVRCRTFHCKISQGAMDFMDSQINEWLDANEQISVKFATSTIGPFVAKTTEPNLILTLFY